MPSDPVPPEAAPPAAGEGRERRLHPWSWLFVLGQQLRQFALPLLVVLFGGRGDRNELYSLVGVGALALYSVLQYFTYRYRIGSDGLTIRSGVFQRTVRHIPFDRLHNVALQQSVLHRMFDVAEVRLESAGGTRPEASMRVLSLADAQALEQRVRHHAAVEPGADTGEVLLALGPGELVRYGLISNRGMLVVAGAFGVAAQTDSRVFGQVAQWVGREWLGWSRQLHLDAAGLVAGTAVLLVAAIVVLRLLSIVIAFLQFQGFELRDHHGRLHVQRGLLTRLRGSLPAARIQAFELAEGLLHRWLGRRGLKVDTMAMQGDGEGKGSLRHLVPIATPERMDAIVARLLPRAAWPPKAWHALPPRTWLRRFVPSAAVWLLLAAGATWRFGAFAAPLLLGVPWAALAARRWVARAGYAASDGLVAVREGWIDHRWRFAEVGKLQGLRLERNPVDRRCGTASLLMDTAGAAGRPGVRVRFLPVAEAEALYARLAAAMRVIPARTGATAAPAP